MDSQPLAWNAGMLWSFGLLVASRLILLALAPVSEPYKRPHFNSDHQYGYYWHSSRTAPFFEITPNIYADMWARSDSWQYLDIAENGYYLEAGPQGYGTVACFPLYPMLVRCLGVVIGRRFLAAALLISAAATWIAAVLLYRLAACWGGAGLARLASVGLFAFPFGFFLTTVFPHSLFLALSLASVGMAERGRFVWAGILAALAGATRTEGVVLIPTLAVAYWSQNGLRMNRQLFGLVLAPMGIAAYMAYLWWRFDRPLAFLDIQHQFGRMLSNPISTLLRPLIDHLFNVRHFLTYLSAVWLMLASLRRVPLSSLVFGWLLFLVPLASGQYESIYRVQMTVYPIYLGMACVRPRWLCWLQLIGLALLELYTCFGFITGVRLN